MTDILPYLRTECCSFYQVVSPGFWYQTDSVLEDLVHPVHRTMAARPSRQESLNEYEQKRLERIVKNQAKLGEC